MVLLAWWITRKCREIQITGVHYTQEEIMERIARMSPEIKYDEKKNKYKQSDCCICLIAFSNDSMIRILECQHIFHGQCIMEHIHRHTSVELRCPMCNIVLKGIYKEEEE